MNYVISSIILLVITIIIIFLLSIDNNIDKFKNKIKDTFSTIKSTQINYLNEYDSNILLHFLKSHYQAYDNIMIPKKVFYTIEKDKNVYVMQDIEIIGFKFNNINTFTENKHTITVKFTSIKNELFIGRYTLFGQNGNYYIESDSSNLPVNKILSNNNVIQPQSILKTSKREKITKPILSETRNNIFTEPRSDYNNTTDIFDMIPDIIHLSTHEEDSVLNTTATPQKNQRA
jgi:hypothetical protein